MLNSREELLTKAVALKTMETHAALTARVMYSNTESKVTRENYDHYQKHYKSWSQNFYDNEIVSNERLIAFLMQEVLFLPKKKPGRKSSEQKKKEEEETKVRWQKIKDLNMTLESLEELDIDYSKIQCGLKTLQGFVTAICDLYNFQNQFQNNCHPHPRTNQVKKLIESVKKTKTKAKDEGFEDRLKDSALDTITLSQYMQNASFLGLNWENSKSEKSSIARRLDLLLMYSCMCRSQIIRYLRLSEVGVETVSSKSDYEHKAIRFSMMKGKKNQFERVQSVGIMRHKNVEYCSISALAIHLVYRFHIEGEEKPDFKNRESWYNSPLLKMNNGHISYTEQRSGVLKALQEFNISCSKKTHLGRDVAVSVGTKAGLSESSMKRQGFWKQDSFSGAYQARVLPYDVIRVLAGFDSEEVSYRLERDFVDPPKELEKMLFPWVEDSIIHVQSLIRERFYTSEHSGLGFLNLLLFLRRVFLQDAAAFYLDSDFSKYSVFQLPLFTTDEFIMFQEKIKHSIHEPANKMLFKAGTESKLNQLLEIQAQQETRERKNFKRLFDKLSDILVSVESNNKKFRKIQKTFEMAAREINEFNSSASSDTEVPGIAEVLVEKEKADADVRKDKRPHDDVAHIHRMASPSVVKTIQMVYREWHQGWDGRSSIVELLNTYKDFSWRHKDDKKLYSRRYKIIREIQKLVEQGNTIDSTFSILEERRGKMAISSFSDGLKS